MTPATGVAGCSLYELVQAYDALEHHRTGTRFDHQTQAWLAEELASRRARVDTTSYEFDQFVVDDHEVVVDGNLVESVPLWYAGEGRCETSHVQRFAWSFSGGNHGTQDAWAALVANDRPSVVATTDIGGMLGVPNRAPRFSLVQPVALVAGALADHLADAAADAEVRLLTSTRRTVGRSTTVFGRFGPPSAAPVVITTPMTGWFRCAGERGTGIAIAIELAAELGDDRSVLFVGTTGHEIGYLGVDRLVAEGGFGTPSAIVHVGASSAAGVVDDSFVNDSLVNDSLVYDRVGTLSPNRMVLSSLSSSAGAAVAATAEAGGLRVLQNPPDWFGEGEMLKRLERPLLSFVGGFPNFHTPLDTIERVTTPAMLDDAADTIGQTVRAFLAATDH